MSLGKITWGLETLTPAERQTERLIGRWLDRNTRRSLAHAKATMDPADLITKDDPPETLNTKLFKGGKQLGVVIWANLRTKECARLELDPHGGFGRRVTGRVTEDTFDSYSIED